LVAERERIKHNRNLTNIYNQLFMKHLSMIFVAFMLSTFLYAQNGYHNYFLTSIGTNTDKSTGKMIVSLSNAGMQVTCNAVGPNYENIEHAFTSQNLSSDAKLVMGVKSSTAFTLRLDLIDVNGKITNTTATTANIIGDNVTRYYEFDFTNKFSQTWPNASSVDNTQISKVAIMPNAGMAAYTGTFYITQLAIGKTSQKGAKDAFSADLFPGWKNQIGYTLTTTSNALNINSALGANSTSGIEFTPGVTMDVSSNANVSLNIKTTVACSLRVDLIDVYGRVSNASPNVKYINASSVMQSINYDFSGKFNQSTPNIAAVNSTKIARVVFYFNYNGSALNSNIVIDDVNIGDGSYDVGSVLTGTLSENIIINQVGYELKGTKKALYKYVNTPSSSFSVYNSNNQLVYTGSVDLKGAVAGWNTGNYAALDFSAVSSTGMHRIKIGTELSYTFMISDQLFFNLTGDGPLNFFQNMRHTGTQDKTLSFNGTRNDLVDVSGGWWDATGDPGKHMSHLSYANYFNPQQIPFVVYSMLQSVSKANFGTNTSAMESEINFGLNYLTKNVDVNGYLYLAIFDDWGNAPSTREICEWGQPGFDNGRTANYQAAMREGAGLAIAALARAASSGKTYDQSSLILYQKALTLYNHLKSAGNGYATKNLEYCNDHTENIIDFYCGLLAATELYRYSNNIVFLNDAKSYVNKILALQGTNGELYADVQKNRPFYHAADEGMPIVAMDEFLKVDATLKSSITLFTKKWLNWQLNITYEVNNPFDYIREYYKPYTTNLGTAKKAFFLPHSNETGYWWQGENARLASMTTALLLAKRITQPNYNFGKDSLSTLAISQLDWILGKNPFNISMMYGYGYKNYPTYLNGTDPNKKVNYKGGICNGITSGVTDENDISFMPYAATDWQNWRWVEQWLPHDSWYLLAISTLSHLQNNAYIDCNNVTGGSAFVDSCGICAGGTTGRAPVLNKSQCETTDMTSLSNTHQLNIYPNPSEGNFSIDSAVLSYSVSVYDHSGKLIEVLENIKSFGDDYSSGLYIVKITTNQQSQIFKLIKK
jgi:hypothetical protein